MTTVVSKSDTDESFFIFNAVVSICAIGFLFWLLVLHHPNGELKDAYNFLPAVNATLNGTAALLLIAGFVAIRRQNRGLHQRLMVAALAASTLFLISYVFYHSVHGDTKYSGTGPLRGIYFFILISHILLSMTVVPLALTAFYFAFRQQFVRHKKTTRWLLPIWLYVSVTGVLIFMMLRAG